MVKDLDSLNEFMTSMSTESSKEGLRREGRLNLEPLVQSPQQSPTAQARARPKVGSGSVEYHVLDLKQDTDRRNDARKVRHDLNGTNGLDKGLPMMDSDFAHNPMVMPQNEQDDVAESLMQALKASEKPQM